MKGYIEKMSLRAPSMVTYLITLIGSMVVDSSRSLPISSIIFRIIQLHVVEFQTPLLWRNGIFRGEDASMYMQGCLGRRTGTLS